MRRLDEGTRRRVTTVVAPTGYGKSVLVAQWRTTAVDRPVAWVDLDAADDDAIHFTRTMFAGLSTVHPDLAAGADQVDVGGRSLGEDLIEQLVANLALVPDVVIVFDNFESLRTPELIADIGVLVERAPPSARVVIISRSDPGIGISRLRLRGDLVELRAADLSMSHAEAATLFERAGIRLLDPKSIDLLVARTSGWPAALQLAALSMRGLDDPTGFVERFSGDDRHVADYLTEEVIATCSADERRFMIETSILETLNGALCDFVTGRRGSHRLLSDLQDRGMLLDRLEGPGEWFRFHPLLRDLLRTELEMSDPSRHRELLRRAADWYRARDDLSAASDYLVRAQAWDELLELSRVHGRTCFERGLTTMLRSRLESMPEALRVESTAATLTLAILRLLTGQAHQADRELSRLEASNRLVPWEQTIIDVTRSAMGAWQLPPDRALESGLRALDRLATIAPVDGAVDVLGITSAPSLEAITLVSVGRAAHYLGRDDESRQFLIQAADRSAEVYLPWHLHSLGARAVMEALAGELQLAMRLASCAVTLALEAGIERHPATAEAHLAVAIVRREEGALADAAFSLRESLGLARSNHRLPLLDLHASESVRLALAIGGPESVSGEVPGEAISAALTSTRPVPMARMASAIASWHLAAGDRVGAEQVIVEHGHLRSTDMDAVAIELALALRDTATARALLDRMSDDRTTRGRIARLALSAVVDDLEGDAAASEGRMSAAVELAEAANLRRVFLDLGPDVPRLLRAHAHGSPTTFVRAILERERERPAGRVHVTALVDQLTDREMAVLQYLPTHLSYAEIAAQLYVSVNTIKTHMKHIYRKLDAEGRSGAISRAESLGLL